MKRDRTEYNKKYHKSESYKISLNKYGNSIKGKNTRKRYRDLWYKTLRGRICSMWNAAKRRAEKKHILFELVKEDIKIPEKCPLLDIKLNIKDFGIRHDSPSLDRKNSAKGYTKKNTWVVSSRANILKNNATIEELELLLKNWKKSERY